MENFRQAETMKVKRSSLNFASYNPRKISDKAKKALRDNIERVGLLGGIVWNKRTGNIVSGHQRITILDEINGYDGGKNDYSLNVEVVDLSEKEEKEQNIFMNNKNVQGEFDNETLKTIISDIDFLNAGFDEIDMVSFGLNGDDIAMSNGIVEPQGDTAKNCDKKTAKKKNYKDEQVNPYDFGDDKKDDVLSCLVISFDTQEDKVRFLNEYGFDMNDNIVEANEFIKKIKQYDEK